MTPQQLEALVLEAVALAKTGNQVEDDRVELKRELPSVSKARQLAGACNRANGALVIYIIGVDEASGEIVPGHAMDIADWWAQIESRFDGVAPEIAHHLSVPVGDGTSVTVIAFNTARSPYVVKTEAGGSPEREVPMRDGSRTRSARRDELLRLLVPTSYVPQVLLLDCTLNATWYAARPDQPAFCALFGHASVYIEHISTGAAFLPAHEMEIEIQTGGTKTPMRPDFSRTLAAKDTPAQTHGVHVRRDGVVASGPGTFGIGFRAQLEGDEKEFLSEVVAWKVSFKFGIAGSSRPALISAWLDHIPNIDPRVYEMQQEIADWKLRG